jgi:hypothetical protein
MPVQNKPHQNKDITPVSLSTSFKKTSVSSTRYLGEFFPTLEKRETKQITDRI